MENISTVIESEKLSAPAFESFFLSLQCLFFSLKPLQKTSDSHFQYKVTSIKPVFHEWWEALDNVMFDFHRK